MLSVGLSEWKRTSIHPIPTITFTNVLLRTLEAQHLALAQKLEV